MIKMTVKGTDTQGLVENFLREFSEVTGEWYGDYIREIINVEEFTDIKHMTVQALINWSEETDEPFEQCVHNFLEIFKAEIENLKAQGFPDGDGVAFTVEAPFRPS